MGCYCLLHQGTLKNLIYHHNSKTSILWHSALFMVQLSYPYTTTRKTITLTRWTFVVKVMSQLFNMLSGFIMASLVAQRVKNLPAVQETQFRSLGWEDPQRRKWQPTPALLPDKFCGLRRLVGYSPWGHRVRHD